MSSLKLVLMSAFMFLACSRQASHEAESQPAELDQTYWKLIELRGQPVTTQTGGREAHLQFSAAEERVAGSTGCNQVSGKYEVRKDSLHVGNLAATRMACEGGVMAQEQAFLDALEATSKWKIVGNKLELSGLDNAILARFEARLEKP